MPHTEKPKPARFPRNRSKRMVKRTLLVGCGDVGLRLLMQQRPVKADILATCRRPEQAQAIRQAGGRPLMGDLGDKGFLRRLARLTGAGLIWMAPPPAKGLQDPYSKRMALWLESTERSAVFRRSARPARSVSVTYVSTTGVYGDRAGALTTEISPLAARNERAIRRVHAENIWRARLQTKPGVHIRSVTVLRAPGIYAADRLPIDRLKAASPALLPAEDSVSNHIHADDLARLSWRARFRSQGRRVFNAVDDEPMKMGDYFDKVARHFGLDAPPRLSRAQAQAAVSPMMWSFMSESRWISNQRLAELKTRLRYPTVQSLLDSLD
jgi:nucleoside-diphosphate-sugar epimerase